MLHRSLFASCASLAVGAAALAQPCTPTFDLALGAPGAPSSNIGVLYPTTFFSPGVRQMFVGGGFPSMGGVAGTSGIAIWNGTTFTPLASGINFGGSTAEVSAATTFGGKLYIGGQFVGATGGPAARGLIRWTGSAFEQVAPDPVTAIFALRAVTVYQNELYVGGSFDRIGTTITNCVAKLNATQDDFVALGTGFGATAGAGIFDMVTFNDGSGDKLYACGNFTSMDGVASTRWIARYNGTAWETVGGGIISGSASSNARDMLVFDDGTGPALYVACGRSSSFGTGAESAVHKWNGVSWTAIPGFQDDPLDVNFTASSIGLYNDGRGTSVLAQVRLSQSGGVNPRQALLKLEGNRFRLVPGVLFDAGVFEIQPFDDGAGLGLRTWLGGSFTNVNGASANRLAQISGCAATCPADFNGVGGLSVQDIFDFLAAWFAGCP